MKNNYSVYQHVTPDNMYYFGATQNVERRWSSNGAEYKRTALQPYIEQYGWENIQHIVLYENLPYVDALKIEDSLIISGWEKGNCINKKRSGDVKKEDWYIKKLHENYYNKNKDNIKEQHKQYYETNKEQILEQKKQYYETNKDKKREYNRQYREQNREKYNEYNREYRQRKKLEKQLKEVVQTTLF